MLIGVFGYFRIWVNESIHEKIFEFTNKKINELNKTGQHLEFIGNDFDEIKKIQFEEKLSEQKTIVSQQIEKLQQDKDKISNGWEGRAIKYFHHKQSYELLQNKLNDYKKLQQAIKSIEFLNQELEKNKNEKARLENLQKIYPQYQKLSDSIDLKNKEFVEKSNSKKELEELLAVDEGKLNQVNEQINLVEQNKKIIEKFIESVPNVYKKIDDLKNIIQDLKKLKEAKTQINSQKNNIQNNIFIDIRENEKFKDDIVQIDGLIEKNVELQQDIQSIKEQQEAYQNYNSQLKELISLGINLIDEKQSNACPLCSVQQDSFEILKERILNNSFLSNIEQNLLAKEKQISLEQTQNNKQIQEIKKSFLNALDEILQNIVQSLKFIDFEDQHLSDNNLEQKIDKYEEEHRILLATIEHKPQEELLALKSSEQKKLDNKFNEYHKNKIDLEAKILKNKTEISLISVAIETIDNDINNLKQKEDYKLFDNWLLSFEKPIDDISQQLENSIVLSEKSINEANQSLSLANTLKDDTIKKYEIIDLGALDENVKNQKEDMQQLQASISPIEFQYKNDFKKEIKDIETVKVNIQSKIKELEQSLDIFQNQITIIKTLETNTTKVLEFIQQQNKLDELEVLKQELIAKQRVSTKLSEEKKKLEKKIENDVQSFFHEELINQIYSKIDPHPEFKKVQFQCSFEGGVGKLNVFVIYDKNNKHISPSLYYSTAQLNVLSLSIFLAKALNAKDDNGNDVNCIFIDDPIQSMDSINILATIDLLRSLVANYDKQIILSTHDENFHRLLEKKIPREYFDSKFIELETFGKVARS